MNFQAPCKTITVETSNKETFSFTHLLIKLTSRKFLVAVGVLVGGLIKVFTRSNDPENIDQVVTLTCAVGAAIAPIVYILAEGKADREREQYLQEHQEDVDLDLSDGDREALAAELGLGGIEPPPTWGGQIPLGDELDKEHPPA